MLESQIFDRQFGAYISSGGSTSIMTGDRVPGARQRQPDSTVARFVFQPPSIPRVVTETAPNFLVLIGYIGVAMLLAFGAFLRYDVR